jgi:hypothetical protein
MNGAVTLTRWPGASPLPSFVEFAEEAEIRVRRLLTLTLPGLVSILGASPPVFEGEGAKEGGAAPRAPACV